MAEVLLFQSPRCRRSIWHANLLYMHAQVSSEEMENGGWIFWDQAESHVACSIRVARSNVVLFSLPLPPLIRSYLLSLQEIGSCKSRRTLSGRRCSAGR